MSFLNNIATYGTPTSKVIAGTKSPAERRTALAITARKNAQLAATSAGDDVATAWFKRQKGGEFHVWLKSGLGVLAIAGTQTRLEVPDREAVVRFFNDAAVAAEAGELDTLVSDAIAAVVAKSAAKKASKRA